MSSQRAWIWVFWIGLATSPFSAEGASKAKPIDFLKAYETVPASEFSVSAEVGAKPTDTDAATIQTLSRKSAELWKDLVACNEGLPESARESYSRERLCKDGKKNSELKNRLSALRKEVDRFLSSTQILDSRFEVNRWSYPSTGVSISVHPLVVELVVESMARQKVFVHIDDRPNKFVKAVSYLDIRVPRRDFDGSMVSNQVKSKGEDIRKRLNEGSFTLLLNGLRFLLLADDRACSGWGLWPHASAAIIRAIEVSNADEASWRNSNVKQTLVEDPALRGAGKRDSVDPALPNRYLQRALGEVRMKHLNACGNLSQTHPELVDESLGYHWITRDTSSAWWINVIQSYRAL